MTQPPTRIGFAHRGQLVDASRFAKAIATGDQVVHGAGFEFVDAMHIEVLAADRFGQLAVIAAADRRFPRQGDPEAVRKYLREAMADGEMYDAVEDAEADWRALTDA